RQRKDARLAASGADLPLGALGSGSDYTPFLQHLGVAALNLDFTGEDDQGGVYHSAYDTFEHYSRFGDPGERYGVACAETVGRLVLRMADADVLPLQFTDFSSAITEYVGELHRLADDKRRDAEDLARLLQENAFALAADPTRRLAPPARSPEVPYFDFSPLDDVAARLSRSARAYDDLYAKVVTGTVRLSSGQAADLNELLRGMEQTLIDARGLPAREWYKHLVYAPGSLTGYGAKTLPAVREGIEQDRFEEAARYIPITAAVLSAYCDRLDRAAAVLAEAALNPATPIAVAPVSGSGPVAARAPPKPQHVFVIVLENQAFATTFGERSTAPYLARTLPAEGALLPNYYGIGHSSLPNYVALISGQAPNRDTQLDCPLFAPFQMSQARLDADGQALGRGC